MPIDNPTDRKIDRWLRRQPPRVAVLMIGLMLAGCTAPVIVENPRTGEKVVCGDGGYEWNPWSQHDACVADHVTQGWTVSSTP